MQQHKQLFALYKEVAIVAESSALGATIVDLSRMGGEKHKQHSYGTSVVVV